MIRTSSPCSGSVRTFSEDPSDNADRPTVAALGIQVRLVRADLYRRHEFMDLIASCEILRHECECLFKRITDFLEDNARDISSSE
jgi:hypothetical protein